jgi:hypothetical protein
MNGIFANYLWTTVLGKRLLNIWNHVIFSAKIQYRCIHVYAWFKGDEYVIWMWIWLILKNISLLDRIWSLWLVRFANSPTNFIFWLDRLIFSASINSHPDNIYLSSSPPAISTYWLHTQKSYQSSRELSRTYQQSAGAITKSSQHLNDNSCNDDKKKYNSLASSTR